MSDEPLIVFETVSNVVHEPNFAIVDGRPVPLPEGKVVTPPRYVRPRARTRAATKSRPRPKLDEIDDDESE